MQVMHTAYSDETQGAMLSVLFDIAEPSEVDVYPSEGFTYISEVTDDQVKIIDAFFASLKMGDK